MDYGTCCWLHHIWALLTPPAFPVSVCWRRICLIIEAAANRNLFVFSHFIRIYYTHFLNCTVYRYICVMRIVYVQVSRIYSTIQMPLFQRLIRHRPPLTCSAHSPQLFLLVPKHPIKGTKGKCQILRTSSRHALATLVIALQRPFPSHPVEAAAAAQRATDALTTAGWAMHNPHWTPAKCDNHHQVFAIFHCTHRSSSTLWP